MCQALVGPFTIVKKSDTIQALMVFNPMTNPDQLITHYLIMIELSGKSSECEL